MKWKDIIRAMSGKRTVKAFNPMDQTYSEECVIKRVYLFCRESGKLSIGAELWGYNSTYNVLAKNIRLSEEVHNEP